MADGMVDERCLVCHGTESNPGNEMLLCQGNMCVNGYHLHCLEPPLECVPEEMWLCPGCQSSGCQYIPRRIISHTARGYKVEWEGGETTLEPRDNLVGTQALQVYEQTSGCVEAGGSGNGIVRPDLPAGWTSVPHIRPSGRTDMTYHGPGGKSRARSLKDAWLKHANSASGTGSTATAEQHVMSAQIPKVEDMADGMVDERCLVCHGTESNPGNEMLLCQGNMCVNGYHLHCLEPPLECVPEEMWLCPGCQSSGCQYIPRRIISHTARGYKVEWEGGETTLEPRDNLVGTQALQVYEQPGGKSKARSLKERTFLKEAWLTHANSASGSTATGCDTTAEQHGMPAQMPRVAQASPALPIPSAAPSRKRRMLFPESVDDKVGKRIKVAIKDHEGGMQWYTAKILAATPCLTSFSDSNVEYLIRYDIDGQKTVVDLEDLPWMWLREGEEHDQQTRGNLECSAVQMNATAAVRPAVPPAVPARNTCTRAVQTEAGLLGSNIVLHRNPVSCLVAEAIESVLARARDEESQAADDLPVMRPLRSVEWFAGSARLTFALRRNHKWSRAVIHDYDASKVEWEQHGTQPDPETFRSDEFLDEVRLGPFYQEPAYDYFHFSIDCSSFTGLGHAGQGRNDGNDYLGTGAACARGNRMVHKTCDLIGLQMGRNPRFIFTIENPFTGRLKEHPMVRARLEAPREHGGLGAVRIVVDYCLFYEHNASTGRAFKKRTIFWSNSPTLIREFGVHAPPARTSFYLCERRSPCPCYGAHRQVNSGTAAEATPFPRLLAEKIARCINLDVAVHRWRPVSI